MLFFGDCFIDLIDVAGIWRLPRNLSKQTLKKTMTNYKASINLQLDFLSRRFRLHQNKRDNYQIIILKNIS